MQNITLITGSTLGGAEYVGDHLSDLMTQENIPVDVINEGEIDDVLDARILLLITSTHGAGDYPENLAPLMEQLEKNAPDLSNLKFAVIAIGDSSYDTFCGAGRAAESLLTGLGAQSLAPMLEIDILEHPLPEEPAEAWLSQHKQAFCE